MINIPAGQVIVFASLYINEANTAITAILSNQNIIADWSFGPQMPLATKGNDLFPGRFFVSYKSNTYTMTLKSLRYNDTGSFLLRVGIGEVQGSTNEIDAAVITISQINGMDFLFIFFCVSMTLGDEISVVTSKQYFRTVSGQERQYNQEF